MSKDLWHSEGVRTPRRAGPRPKQEEPRKRNEEPTGAELRRVLTRNGRIPRGPKPDRRGFEQRPDPTAEELLRRAEVLSNLVLTGADTALIYKSMQNEFGTPPIETARMLGELRLTMLGEFEEKRASYRAVQVSRLERHLVTIKQMAKPDHHAAVLVEDKLAKIVGTYQPLRVKHEADVEFVQNVNALLSNLSPEERERMVAEQLELERRAAGGGR
jgi:hypothetical protein